MTPNISVILLINVMLICITADVHAWCREQYGHIVSTEFQEMLHRHCGSALRSVPAIEVVPYAQFVASRSSNSGNVEECHGGVYYQKSNNTIVIRDGFDITYDVPRRGVEIDIVQRMVYLHELVHAWQAENWETSPWFRSATPLARRAIREGHAEWVVRRYAEDRNLVPLLRRFDKARFQMDHNTSNVSLIVNRFLYVDGRDFISRSTDASGIFDIMLLKEELDIDEYYIAYGRRSDWNAANMARKMHESLRRYFARLLVRPGCRSCASSQWSSLSLLSLRASLSKLGVDAAGRRQMEPAFVCGDQILSEDVSVVLISFVGRESNVAQRYYRLLSGGMQSRYERVDQYVCEDGDTEIDVFRVPSGASYEVLVGRKAASVFEYTRRALDVANVMDIGDLCSTKNID